MKLSCVTASYVADLLGYPGNVDWGLASRTIERAPMLQTLSGILDRLAPARLGGLEIWYPHASPSNLTPVLAAEVRRRLAAQGMVCCACAGSIGDPEQDPYGCEASFQTARLLGAPVIAGHLRAGTARRLGEMAACMGVRVAYENGPEKDVAEIVSAIDGGNEWIGVNIDTGNLASRGGDPVQAIRVLGKRVLHVHLKDIPAIHSHQCVAIGAGIVDVEGVLRELQACGYDGWLSIEIETGDHDPTAEILRSAETIRRLWRDE